jgi:hypothetical protein
MQCDYAESLLTSKPKDPCAHLDLCRIVYPNGSITLQLDFHCTFRLESGIFDIALLISCTPASRILPKFSVVV